MRREPPMTFSGALKVLGHYERPLVDRLDRLLGGVILGAGAAAAFGALWGSVDQKNEAVGLLRTCLDEAESRLSGLRGYERMELIAAAHTILVVSSFFDVLRDVDATTLRRDEAEVLATGRARRDGESLLSVLSSAEVPMPGGAYGFVENTARVRSWLDVLAARTMIFLDAPPVGKAVARYETAFLRLAATVPDFAIWASLSEHAATRAAVSHVRGELAAALAGNTAALSRVEALLEIMAAPSAPPTGAREALHRANRDVLGQPVVRSAPGADQPAFPTVGDGYVNPTYRLAVAGGTARPADESWWAEMPVHTVIDLMITGHLAGVDAVRRPLLLLGHPGGGKSMLTRILAARLPAGSYTVVRVPLRQVGANAPIYQQIGQALEIATHGRAGSWPELTEQSAGTVRLVLLDGLDELLQATTNDRTGYLDEVVEFQRVEAGQGHPVMVVVTSRTVVAERVDIPAGTPIAKLDEFDDGQIGQWLDAWALANAGRSLRVPTVAEALAHEQLARQPLLLLMLAIYWADPQSPPDTAGLSLTRLYERLLAGFAVREVGKRAGHALRGEALDRAAAEQLRRLSVAAIGMFNRGRQDITEQELSADLDGLYAAPESGRRVLGEFFFVHAAEARVRAERGDVRRCYEFLHATFGEYLIAALVVEELADVADAAFGGSRGRREPVDDLLHALLRHQTMASRRPILDFAAELVGALPAAERTRIAETLEALIRRYDQRVDNRRYARYRPLPESSLRPLAAYSANLVLLRVALDGETPLAVLAPGEETPADRWRSTVTLWRAGLDADGWQAMLDALDRTGDAIRLRSAAGAFPSHFADIQYARLLGDHEFELRLRLGSAFRRVLYYVEGDDWAETMSSWLLPAVALPAADQPGFVLIDPPPGTPDHVVAGVLAMISDALVRQTGFWSADFVTVLLTWVERVAGVSALSPVALAAALEAHPHLLRDMPALRDPGLYRDRIAAWLIWSSASAVADEHWTALVDGLGPEDDSPERTRAFLKLFVRQATAPVPRLPVPRVPDHSIMTNTAAGPVPMGSVTGVAADWTWEVDAPPPG